MYAYSIIPIYTQIFYASFVQSDCPISEVRNGSKINDEILVNDFDELLFKGITGITTNSINLKSEMESIEKFKAQIEKELSDITFNIPIYLKIDISWGYPFRLVRQLECSFYAIEYDIILKFQTKLYKASFCNYNPFYILDINKSNILSRQNSYETKGSCLNDTET